MPVLIRKEVRTDQGCCRPVEALESRLLLSASIHKANQFPKLKKIKTHSTLALELLSSTRITSTNRDSSISESATGTSLPSVGLTPVQIRGAYQSNNINFYGVVGDGTGQTIAIVDPYDDPNLISSTSSKYSNSDLYLFDEYYNLPNPPSFTKFGVNEPGRGQATVSASLPGTDPSGPYLTTGTYSGTLEESLDVEWAHVMAPGANIVLIESNSYSDIYLAVQAANNLPGVSVVSMSFSGDEKQLGSAFEENLYNSTYFNQAGITYVASDGDWGAYGNISNGEQNSVQPQFPASSQAVLAVGGTSLSASGTTWSSETSWGNGTSSGSSGGGGGGISLYLGKPSYQSALLGSSGNREYPDVSLDGNPATGVPVLDSWDCGAGTGWINATVGGTSLAAPMMAGLVAVADQGRALDRMAPLNSNGLSGGTDIHSLLYSLAGSTAAYNPNEDFHDISTGNAIGPSPTYFPLPGFDLTSGLGSPIASSLIFDLSGISSTTAINLPAITSLYYREDSAATLTDVWVNAVTPGTGTATYQFVSADISSVLFIGASGNDCFTLDLSYGNSFATSLSSITYGGSATGVNSLLVVGSAAGNDMISATSSNVSIGAITVGFSNVSNLTLDPGTGTDSLVVSSGTWNIAPQVPGGGILTRNFSNLSIAAGADLLFTTAAQHTDRTLVETSSLSVAGQLDLGGNDMIVHNGSLSAVTALLAKGWDNGSWTGTGIASAAAANDTTHLTALGVIANDVYGGSGQPQFDGTTPSSTDILIKYTYYGDTNLDGKVDGSDYSRIDNGYLTGLTGWENGDFNDDNKIDGSDYSLIDNAFNAQRIPL